MVVDRTIEKVIKSIGMFSLILFVWFKVIREAIERETTENLMVNITSHSVIEQIGNSFIQLSTIVILIAIGIFLIKMLSVNLTTNDDNNDTDDEEPKKEVKEYYEPKERRGWFKTKTRY